MRRGIGIGVLLLVILAGIALGVGAYHAGVSHGVAEAASDGRVVRVVGPGYGFGFFPFGLFLFPLFFIALFSLFRWAWWGRSWGHDHDHSHGHHGHGPFGPGGHDRFEEWHRRQHEQDAGDHTPSGGEPSSV
jgi:hypothetical protein